MWHAHLARVLWRSSLQSSAILVERSHKGNGVHLQLRRLPARPLPKPLETVGKLNQFNGNYIAAEMVKAFITSSEHQRRFGPLLVSQRLRIGVTCGGKIDLYRRRHAP